MSVFKPRRAVRSDDYLRLCEARKELLKKCNGEAPDKSQLRMYDMIYYNPKSNPMKRHAEEAAAAAAAALEAEKEGEGGVPGAKQRRISEASNKDKEPVKKEQDPLEQDTPKEKTEAVSGVFVII